MNEVVVLTPERILEATEEVLRRYGLAKATVVDVARALDVSHGSVYRHFPSKASLRQAVAKRWLDRANAPLQKIAESAGPAPARLEKWLRTMIDIK
jgi:AcrR family transcriptional regulator